MTTDRDGIFHLTYAADGRHALFPDEAQRRRAVRALTRVRGGAILLFCIVDDHVHIVFRVVRRRAGTAKKAFHNALAPIARIRLMPGRLKRVNDRSHLQWLVTYLLRQVIRHGLGVHAALWSGSCFQDLVGARWLPGLLLHLGSALPRFQQADAYRAVGLPGPPRPAGNELLRTLGASRIAAAAASATAADPGLRGNRAEVVAARRAAVQLGVECGIPTVELAWALGISLRSVQHLARAAGAPGELLAAIRLRVALEEMVAAQAHQGQAS